MDPLDQGTELNSKNIWRSILQKIRPKNLCFSFINWCKELSWPNKYQWKQFFKVLTKAEKYLIIIFTALIVISAVFPIKAWYLNNTALVPDYGGIYTEAAIGSPRYLNPVLAPASDVDRDLSVIIYSGLFKHGSTDAITLDLAEDYFLSEDNKIYTIFLRKDVKWHDGKNLTADDIIFTTQVIQNPDYRSPLRTSLQGVEVEKIDNYTLRFKLKNPYRPFLDNLTFGILPKHIWGNIPPTSFALSELNLKPIGSGPYKFKKIIKDSTDKIKSLELTAFSDYYFKKPYIGTVIFKFFKDESSAVEALNRQEVDSISFISAKNIGKLKNNPTLNKFILPRYFAVFFNQTENKALAEINVRQALSLATNKKEIVEGIIANQGVTINTPLPSFIFNNTTAESHIASDKTGIDFDLEQAKDILETGGWNLATSSAESTESAEVSTSTPNIRQKLINNEKIALEISLTTVDWPELVEVANFLKESWEKIGAKINLEINNVVEMQEKIKSRQYQALLFGQILGASPDPFPFWHSSQKRDPGLNLALYENKEVDKILEEMRQDASLSNEAKFQKYDQFQKLVIHDIPAIFLYSPVYLYPINSRIQGIQLKQITLPSDRFSQIENWYIETKRGWVNR